MEKKVVKARLIPLNSNHNLNVENVKEYMARRNYKVHLEKGEFDLM